MLSIPKRSNIIFRLFIIKSITEFLKLLFDLIILDKSTNC